jgi:hypothetical protein
MAVRIGTHKNKKSSRKEGKRFLSAAFCICTAASNRADRPTVPVNRPAFARASFFTALRIFPQSHFTQKIGTFFV